MIRQELDGTWTKNENGQCIPISKEEAMEAIEKHGHFVRVREVISYMTLGVVAKKPVASFQRRVFERQFEVAAKLADRANAQISNWGSDYSWPEIEKWRAQGFVNKALSNLREELKVAPTTPSGK